MISKEEIQRELTAELFRNLDKIGPNKISAEYYNSQLGYTSVLLAGLLSYFLKDRIAGWDSEHWADDCLISDAYLFDTKLVLGGVVILGEFKSTLQWTEPFLFEMHLDVKNGTYYKYELRFADSKLSKITYEKFVNNRSYWGKSLLDNYDATDRKWEFYFYSS